METASRAISDTATLVTPTLEFQDLYQRYSETVYLTALRVMGNPVDAEDILQTVFLRVLDRRLVLDSSWSPEGYLRRAAANASIDLLRRRKTRPESAIDEERDHSSKESTLLLKERLRRALAQLPPESAELFVLCYLEGYTYDELADLLQIERGTVGSRLHRIRAILQKDLTR